jgi:hypothetical protein
MQFAARRIVLSRQARDAHKGKLTTRCVFFLQAYGTFKYGIYDPPAGKTEPNKQNPCFLHCPSLAKNHDGLPTQARDRRKATRRFNSKKMFGHFRLGKMIVFKLKLLKKRFISHHRPSGLQQAHARARLEE